jgi:hypothetical protein
MTQPASPEDGAKVQQGFKRGSRIHEGICRAVSWGVIAASGKVKRLLLTLSGAQISRARRGDDLIPLPIHADLSTDIRTHIFHVTKSVAIVKVC